MAFATQEDVFSVIEDVFPTIFAQYGTYHTASKAPFRRISFNDAMETYGSCLLYTSRLMYIKPSGGGDGEFPA